MNEQRAVGVPDGLAEVFAALFDEMESRWKNYNGDAPGHSHYVPGIWDSDNGERAGKPCAWCALWRKGREMRNQLAAPATPADTVVGSKTEQATEADRRDAERYRWLKRKVSAHGICHGWEFAFPSHLELPAPSIAMRDPATGLDNAIDAALRSQAGSTEGD